MYINAGNFALVSGNSGLYDNMIANVNARFGRNAADNYRKYIQSYSVSPVNADFSENDTAEQTISKTENFLKQLEQQQAQMPPINFKYNYMPIVQRGLANQQALLGAAYEEMNCKLAIPTAQMDAVINNSQINPALTADALDLNRDGNIDIAEYSTSILLADMLDEDGMVDVGNIDGVITNKGENKLLGYGLVQNKELAYKTYMSLYQGYGLQNAACEFVSNQNNSINI